MTFDPAHAQVFRYEDVVVDTGAGVVTCRYSLDELHFEEQITFPAGGDWGRPAVTEAVRLLFLLAGVSYYKAAAPPVIDLGDHGLTEAEETLLRSFYLDGLGEYAYRNGLDLSGLQIKAARRQPPKVGYAPEAGRPLIPFGGGIDSIVTVESVRPKATDAALFVVGMGGCRFAAIEDAAAVTGLPVVRAERVIDAQIREGASRGLNFRNGHIPVTGIISAIAIIAATLQGRDAVIMSNEWSASMGNVEVDGRTVNHQFSKSLAFERDLRAVLTENLGGLVGEADGTEFEYFSFLRPFTEVWVAQSLAALPQYHDVFRSCNKAFYVDPAKRLDHWCGHCDKCAFIDLILAPFVPAAGLAEIFGGHEPLAEPAMADTLRTLVGVTGELKPFECVGDVDECRVAALLTAQRPDRAGNQLVAQLAVEARAADPALATDDGVAEAARAMMLPIPPHFVPARYAPPDLVV